MVDNDVPQTQIEKSKRWTILRKIIGLFGSLGKIFKLPIYLLHIKMQMSCKSISNML